MPKTKKKKKKNRSHYRPTGARPPASQGGPSSAAPAAVRRWPLPAPVLIALGIALALAVVAGALVLLWPRLFPPPAHQARHMPDQGREHILPGQLHPPYNSVPPTSGWHYAETAPWGIHDQPIPDEIQVHNLEHGGILVQYNCPQGCPELVEQLKSVVSRYRSKVILAPYPHPDLKHRIALTAWTWIDTFDEFDEQRIVSFIESFINRGPERVPD